MVQWNAHSNDARNDAMRVAQGLSVSALESLPDRKRKQEASMEFPSRFASRSAAQHIRNAPYKAPRVENWATPLPFQPKASNSRQHAWYETPISDNIKPRDSVKLDAARDKVVQDYPARNRPTNGLAPVKQGTKDKKKVVLKSQLAKKHVRRLKGGASSDGLPKCLLTDLPSPKGLPNGKTLQSAVPVSQLLNTAWTTASPFQPPNRSDCRQHVLDETSESPHVNKRDSIAIMLGIAREHVGHNEADGTNLQTNQRTEIPNGKKEPTMAQLENGSPEGSAKCVPSYLPDDWPDPNRLEISYPAPMELPDDFEPSGIDVIMGPGQAILRHPGSKRFRAFIAVNMMAYRKITYCAEMALIADTIIERVTKGSSTGGFVKKDAKTGKWRTVDYKTARTKVKDATSLGCPNKCESKNTESR
jgi:hypothetical protein